ncbi:MAG: hypothetical protein ACFCVH_19770 [Alphaproteobacteria bacterium]
MKGSQSVVVAGFVAFAAAGGYGLGVATAPQPAVAQGGDVIDLDVYARLDALETTVDVLNRNVLSRLDALDTRMTGAEDELARPRNVVQAPFRIVAEGGRELVSVTTDGGLPVMTIGDGIVLGYAESQPRVSIFSGDGRVAGMHLLDGVATLYASQDGIDGFFAGPSPMHGNGVRVFEGGEAVINLGVPPGKGAAARFFTGGTLIAGVGIGTGGDGTMYTGYPDGSAAVTAGGNGGGQASVDVHHGGSVVASMNTTDLGGTGLIVVRNSGGTAVSYISEGAGGGGSISATDAGGNEAFGAGWDGSEGAACVRRRNGNQFCLEPVMPLTRVQ